MENVFKLLLWMFTRIWNYNYDKMLEWKGSFPNWRWKQTYSLIDWITLRKKEEGAEGLWRVYDKLYDLTEWTKTHPGGSSWISSTKGFDITEAFESHHISNYAETILPKYFVREAKTPRNSPFTFRENGFYRTLKRRVWQHLENHKHEEKSIRRRSALISDLLLITSLLLAVAGAKYSNYYLLSFSGITLSFVVTCGHNYFHQKDNFRMFYFNLSLFSYRDWRMSHSMSHHLYPNSRYDLEVTLFAPFLQMLPLGNKTYFSRYVSWIYFPIVYGVVFHKRFFERLLYAMNPDGWAELIPFIYPAAMMFLGGVSLLQALLLWQIPLFVGSLTFVFIGVNAGHHHPDIFHDGDYAREDKDWGLYQLDAVRDRLELKGSLPLVMITFGDHTMHHLFPTLDQAQLDGIYPILMEVYKEFGFDLTFSSQLEQIKGQFRQLARTEPKLNYKPQLFKPNIINPNEIRN